MEKLTCQDRDTIIGDGTTWGVHSTITDFHGTFGEPAMGTTWSRGKERLRDIRFPNPWDIFGQDAKPCEHYYWIELGEDENR